MSTSTLCVKARLTLGRSPSLRMSPMPRKPKARMNMPTSDFSFAKACREPATKEDAAIATTPGE
eukprot:2201140-Alexandrium_andersonii.AAC.1